MKPAIQLKEKLAGTDLVLGVLITFHLSLELIETAMRAGLDYVIIDLEHLDHGEEHVVDACRLDYESLTTEQAFDLVVGVLSFVWM